MWVIWDGVNKYVKCRQHFSPEKNPPSYQQGWLKSKAVMSTPLSDVGERVMRDWRGGWSQSIPMTHIIRSAAAERTLVPLSHVDYAPCHLLFATCDRLLKEVSSSLQNFKTTQQSTFRTELVQEILSKPLFSSGELKKSEEPKNGEVPRKKILLNSKLKFRSFAIHLLVLNCCATGDFWTQIWLTITSIFDDGVTGNRIFFHSFRKRNLFTVSSPSYLFPWSNMAAGTNLSHKTPVTLCFPRWQHCPVQNLRVALIFSLLWQRLKILSKFSWSSIQRNFHSTSVIKLSHSQSNHVLKLLWGWSLENVWFAQNTQTWG